MLYNHFIEKEVKQSNNSIHAYGEKVHICPKCVNTTKSIHNYQ